MIRCPGQDQRFWKSEDVFDVRCPSCGNMVEFFKDEPKLECCRCGQMIANPKTEIGCAEWCQHAEQCLEASPADQADYLRDKLIDQMKQVFAEDQKRIEHALAVLNYAEQIQETEGGDPLIVRAAAILHDIGIREAERKYGSAAGRYQEIKGQPIAEKILKTYDVSAETIEHVRKIVANHHSARDIDTVEFRIVWDADWLVNVPADFSDAGKERLREIIDRTFKTNTGHRMAVEVFLGSDAVRAASAEPPGPKAK